MKTFSSEEARQWVESRAWAEGWQPQPDATVNEVEFATQYARNPQLWSKLFAWLATTDLNALQPGKIVLEEGRLWVNVLEYTPKDAATTKIESHQRMIDLQYTFEGKELMGLATDVEPLAPYNDAKDVTNYSTSAPISYTPADPSRFFLYFPADMHQPSVAASDPAVPSRKIVGKIIYSPE